MKIAKLEFVHQSGLSHQIALKEPFAITQGGAIEWEIMKLMRRTRAYVSNPITETPEIVQQIALQLTGRRFHAEVIKIDSDKYILRFTSIS